MTVPYFVLEPSQLVSPEERLQKVRASKNRTVIEYRKKRKAEGKRQFCYTLPERLAEELAQFTHAYGFQNRGFAAEAVILAGLDRLKQREGES
jgi:excinuclease UvrABC helicase subunit UvrB